MTREEAIGQLKFMLEQMPKEPPSECDYIEEWLDTDRKIRSAFKTAIKIIEQEPCEDAVSRQAVVQWLENATDDSIEHAIDSNLEFIPSVTPTRKKGKWERGYSFPDGEYVKCTVCGEIIKCIYPMHFCPNCGAEMKSEE